MSAYAVIHDGATCVCLLGLAVSEADSRTRTTGRPRGREDVFMPFHMLRMNVVRSFRWGVAFVLVCSSCAGGQRAGGEGVPKRLRIETRTTSVLRGHPLSPGASRSLLVVWGGESMNKEAMPETGVCHVLDLSAAEPTFRKTFSLRGDATYSFHSGLLEGWGVATEVTQDPFHRRILWLNPLSGMLGDTIVDDEYVQNSQQSGSEVLLKGGVSQCMYKINMEKGAVTKYLLPLWRSVYCTGGTCIGLADIEGRPQVTQIDFDACEAVVWGMPPLGQLEAERVRTGSASPAGEGCEDGAYFVTPPLLIGVGRLGCQSSVWWMPRGGDWTLVARDVPYSYYFSASVNRGELWAVYMGEGRFAVAKCVHPEHDFQKAKPTNEAVEPTTAITMLIDGKTGRVLEETPPYAHGYITECHIPRGWLSEKLRRQMGMKEDESGEGFLPDGEGGFLRYGKGQTIPMPQGTSAAVSPDGRRFATWRRGETVEAPNKPSVVVEDSISNTVKSFTVTSEKRFFCIETVQWVDFLAPSH